MSGEADRAVFSIVCVAMAEDARPDSGAALRSREDLRSRIAAALREGGVTADNVAYVDGDAAVACFHNSSAALDFARALAGLPADDNGGPCRASVHMGAVNVHGSSDAELAHRPAVRAGLQLMRAAPPGHALASQLFYNIVSQFDHRCKDLLVPVGSRSERTGAQVFEIRAGSARAAEPRARRAPRAQDGALLPTDPVKRQACLAQAERTLAEEIGPMARIVVQRAAENVPTKIAFWQRVVAAVPDPGRREALMRKLAVDDGA